MNEMTGGRTRGPESDATDEVETSTVRNTRDQEAGGKQRTNYREALQKQFLIVGGSYYYRHLSNTVAFEDRGGRLTTEFEDPRVIHGMLLRAREKGWTSIHVRGSDQFRAEAWLQVRLVGLSVEGYEPREMDFAKLADRLQDQPDAAHRDQADEPALRQDNGHQKRHARHEDGLNDKQDLALRTLEAILLERGDSPEMRAAVLKEARERFTGQRIVVGRLVEHGIQPFLHHEENENSYVVKVMTEQGMKEVWGKDLARAIEQSDIRSGDLVALVQQSREPVVIQDPVRDAQGQVTGTTARTVSRNVWDVLNLSRLGEPQRDQMLRAAEMDHKDSVVPVYDHTAAKRGPDPVVTPTKSQERVRGDR